MAADGSIVIDTKIDNKNLKTQVAKISSELKKVQTNTGSTFAKMRDAMQGPVAALGMIKNAIIAIGNATVMQAAAIEDMEAAFTPLVGGAENAKLMIEALNREAATTPFELNGIAKVAKQLLPVLGNDVEAVTETFRMLGDTAGGNIQTLDTITRGYMKTMLKGKVDMESMNMIAEAGVPIYTELAASMGVTVTELMEMSKSGKITSDDMTKAFQRMTSEGGIFFNGMIIASQTFNGKMSTLTGNLKLAGAAIGKQLLPELKKLVDEINVVIVGFLKFAKRNEDLGSRIKETIKNFKEMTGFGGLLRDGFLLLIKSMMPVVLVFKLLKTAILGIVNLQTNWSSFMQIITNTLENLKTRISIVGISIKTALIVAFNGAKIAALSFAGVVIDKVFGAISKLIAVLSKLPVVGDMFKDIATDVDGFKQEIDKAKDAATRESQNAIASAQAKKAAIIEAGNSEIETSKRVTAGNIAAQKAKREAEKEGTTEHKANLAEINTADENLTNATIARTDEKVSGNEKLKKSLGEVKVKYLEISSAMSKEFTDGILKIKEVGGSASSVLKEIQEVLNIVTFAEPIKQAQSFYDGIIAISDGIKTIIKDGPKMAEEMAQAFLDAVISIIDNLPALASALVKIFETIVVKLAENLPEIITGLIKAALTLGPTLALAVIKALPAMVKALALLPIELVKALPAAFRDVAVDLWGIGVEIVNMIGDGILAIGSFLQWIADIIPKPSDFEPFNIADIGRFIVQQIVNGINFFGAIFNHTKNFFEALPAALTALFTGMFDIGSFIVQGVVDGILAAPTLWDSVGNFFKDFAGAVKRFFLIASPSGLFEDFGGFIVQGLVDGINGADNIFDSVKGVFEGLMTSIGDLFAGGFDLGKSLVESIADGAKGAKSVGESVAKGAKDVVDDVKDFLGFSEGGYTGNGSKDQVAGVVHGQEYVLNADETKALGLNNGKSISSIMEGLKGGAPIAVNPSNAMNINITLNNVMNATMIADGQALAKLVYRNIDIINTGAYGTNR